jgi:ABC-type uncharacterized transport system substrate-binding protein
MRRRDFIALLGGAAAQWPLSANAQNPPNRVFRVGLVQLFGANDLPKRAEAFRAGLHDLGYQEGRNIVIEYRWADGHYDRLPALFADLVRLNVDVIVTHGTPGVLAAKRATSTIPIVIAASSDAVASRLVESLGRPGANVTGLTFFNPELAAKRLEFLKETLPGLTHVAILLNPANPNSNAIMPTVRRTAQALNLEMDQFDVRGPAEFEGAFAAMGQKRLAALALVDDPILVAHSPAIANLALRYRLPSCGWPKFAVEGGLIGYGIDFPDLYRRAAAFVGKILNGTKPADLPVERASKFQTVVNGQTAKSLGLDMPVTILVRADEVIE